MSIECAAWKEIINRQRYKSECPALRYAAARYAKPQRASSAHQRRRRNLIAAAP